MHLAFFFFIHIYSVSFITYIIAAAVLSFSFFSKGIMQKKKCSLSFCIREIIIYKYLLVLKICLCGTSVIQL